MAAAPETSNATLGRLAGAAYVSLVITGIFALAYTPKKLGLSSDDPQAVYNAISEATFFYSASVVTELVCYALFAIVGVFLYRLFSSRAPSLSLIMLVLVAASVPISYIAMAQKVEVLDIARGSGDFAALAASERPAAVAEMLNAYSAYTSMAEIFWGLWLIPFGMLVLKTRYIPRLLGLLLVLGGLGYIANDFGPMLFPAYKGTMAYDIASMPSSFGEIGAALWLLIFGAKKDETA